MLVIRTLFVLYGGESLLICHVVAHDGVALLECLACVGLEPRLSLLSERLVDDELRRAQELRSEADVVCHG